MGLISRVSSRTYRNISMTEATKLFRSLLREVTRSLRGLSNKPVENLQSTFLYTETTSQFRKYQPSQNQYARHRQAATQDAKTFLDMLQSNREHRFLLDKYHGAQTNTTAQAAARVGLSVPENK